MVILLVFFLLFFSYRRFFLLVASCRVNQDIIFLESSLLFGLLGVIDDHISIRIKGLWEDNFLSESKIDVLGLSSGYGVVFFGGISITIIESFHPLDKFKVILIFAFDQPFYLYNLYIIKESWNFMGAKNYLNEIKIKMG